jgi:hypothetical protein
MALDIVVNLNVAINADIPATVIVTMLSVVGLARHAKKRPRRGRTGKLH